MRFQISFKWLTILLLPIAWNEGLSQASKMYSQSLTFNYLQIREALNYGIVFRGGSLHYGRRWAWNDPDKIIGLEPELGLAVLGSRGMKGVQAELTPVRFFYLKKWPAHPNFRFGPLLDAAYHIQFYHDLQNGFSFWLTQYSLGWAAGYRFSSGKNQFDLTARASVLSATSRPPAERDPYFYDLSPGSVLRSVHRDFRIGSWERFRRLEAEIRWRPGPNSGLAVAWAVNYRDYRQQPAIQLLDQRLKLIFIPKKI